MKKQDIKVGQILAEARRGWDRDNYSGHRVEVAEVDAVERRTRYPYGRVTGTAVRYLDIEGQPVKIVPNANLWLPWSEFVEQRTQFVAREETKRQRAEEAYAQKVAEREEINAGLVRAGLSPIKTWGYSAYSPERDALLALIRKVEGR